MKLAVIDHIGNPGGGSRVVRALLPAFKTLRPDMEITYFGNPVSIKRENIEDEFSSVGIRVIKLKSVRLANEGILGIKKSAPLIRLVQSKYGKYISFLPSYFTGAVHEEMQRVAKGFDLAFFPWPYLAKCPSLDCPMVGIFHDFNFKYYFAGVHVLPPWQLRIFNREMQAWLSACKPVVSTRFMANELKKFYPEYAEKAEIVHLASMSTVTKISHGEAKNIVKELGIKDCYMVYPTNMCSHKNIGPLLAAVPLLKKMGHDITLVVTGPGTEILNGHACEIGLELNFGEQNVVGLGYVTNQQMDALIQCASVVVSTSLYEAGNGPGLDAWARGVPVAMSNIPAFKEHMDVQDVRAEVFDPRDPKDIAEKIHYILANPEKAEADARYSQDALGKITWTQTAEKYLNVFDKAMKGAERD